MPLYYRRAPLKPEDRMKPGHEERQKIIREWMAFPKDKLRMRSDESRDRDRARYLISHAHMSIQPSVYQQL